MSLIAGVDAGGSHTTAVIARDGQVAGKASGQGAALRSDTVLRSATTILEVVRQGLRAAGGGKPAVLCAGVAGAGDKALSDQLSRALRSEELAGRVVVTTDVEIALTAAFPDGGGILLLAGTGSVAAIRDADGSLRSVGGLGWRMGDEGSGYAVGQAALAAVGRAHQQRGDNTALESLILERLRLTDVDRLVRWSTTAAPAEIARLTEDVSKAAQEGDSVALEIAAQAASQLFSLLDTLAAAIEGPRVPVALAGGLMASESAIRKSLVGLIDQASRLELLDGEIEPAMGALALARRTNDITE